MIEITTGNTIGMQTTASLQGNSALHALRGLGGALKDASGRSVADANRREDLLRDRVDEAVGITFFGTLLKTMQNSTLKGSYGHGGRGEEVFRGQLNLLLAKRIGQASSFELNEAVYRSLSGRSQEAATGRNAS